MRVNRDNTVLTLGAPPYCRYWDWSLDWMNLASSSIWSSTSGFGGDGNPNGPETVGQGRCVMYGGSTEDVAVHRALNSESHGLCYTH